MSFHAAKSPSKAEQFGNCAGSLALVEALPAHQKNISGDAAKLGTCVHALIETCLGKGEEPEAYRGRLMTIGNDAAETCKLLPKSAKTPKNQYWCEVDDDIIDGATMFTDYVRARRAELGGDEACEMELESRTNPLPDRDDTSGTADTTLKAWPIVLEVADYKNGWNIVEHFGNKQLRAYLLGKAIESNFEYARYRITVIQPNAEHEDGKIRFIECTAAELKAFQKEYRAMVEACDVAADAKGAPKPGKDGKPVFAPEWGSKYLKAATDLDKKDWCMFCDAKTVCPAYIFRRQAEASMDFQDEPEELEGPKTAADVSRILAWKPMFDALFKAAYMWGLNDLTNGVAVPGQKLVRSKGRRKFKPLSVEELAGILVRKYKLTRDQIFRDELKTGPQIEKLLPKKLRDKYNAELLFVPEGTLTMVRDDDAREEVTKHAGDDFEGIDDDDFG